MRVECCDSSCLVGDDLEWLVDLVEAGSTWAAAWARAAVSKPYRLAVVAPSIIWASPARMSAKFMRTASLEKGKVPSLCGKSLPHMILSTPICSRRATSAGVRRLAPIQQLRAKYWLGSQREVKRLRPPLKMASMQTPGRACAMRCGRVLTSVPATHPVPCSVKATLQVRVALEDPG